MRGAFLAVLREPYFFLCGCHRHKSIHVAEFDIEKLLSFMWPIVTHPFAMQRYRPPFLLCLISFFSVPRVKASCQIEI